ncbi:MAG: arylesterase [Bacteriovoracaceae bacterium]|nr:arylesterase [Bacteriovoracaceae bacterium]
MKSIYIITLFFSFTSLVFANEPRKILFIGDSLTAGYGVAKEKSYVSLIEKELNKKNKNVKILNGSVSGSTTSSGKKRLRWFLKAKPEILVLALGANDGLRGVKIKTSQENLDGIIELAKKNNINVALAGMMLPPNYGPEYTGKFKKMYKDLVKKHKLVHIPFLLEGVAAQKELNQADGIHPNEAGHLIMKKTVLKYLEPML